MKAHGAGVPTVEQRGPVQELRAHTVIAQRVEGESQLKYSFRRDLSSGRKPMNRCGRKRKIDGRNYSGGFIVWW